MHGMHGPGKPNGVPPLHPRPVPDFMEPSVSKPVRPIRHHVPASQSQQELSHSYSSMLGLRMHACCVACNERHRDLQIEG